MLINLKTKKYDFVIEYKKIDEKIRQVNRSCVIKYKKKSILKEKNTNLQQWFSMNMFCLLVLSV